MTVRVAGDDSVVLEGPCDLEEAESLAGLLLSRPGSVVDWTACERMHTAVAQVLLRVRPPVRGRCGDVFIARWLAPALSAERDEN